MKLYSYFCLVLVFMSVASNATHPLLLAWLEIIEVSQRSSSLEQKKKEYQQKESTAVALLRDKRPAKQQNKPLKIKRTLPRNKE